MKNKWPADRLADLIYQHTRFHKWLIGWLERSNIIAWKKGALRLIRWYVAVMTMTKAWQGEVCVKHNDQWTHTWTHRGIEPPSPGLSCWCGRVKWADMDPSDIEQRDDIAPLWINGVRYEQAANNHSQTVEEAEDGLGEVPG